MEILCVCVVCVSGYAKLMSEETLGSDASSDVGEGVREEEEEEGGCDGDKHKQPAQMADTANEAG